MHGWYFEPNIFRYSIKAANIGDEIEQNIKKLLKLYIDNNIGRSSLIENFLSCYFLKKYNNQWVFRDNNILFFLLAERFIQTLDSLVENFKDKGLNFDVYEIF